MGVSIGWVYKNKKLLPHRRVGSLYFFHKPTIAQFLAEGHTPDEIVETEATAEEMRAHAKGIVKSALSQVGALAR